MSMQRLMSVDRTSTNAERQKHHITRYTFYAERGYLPHCSPNDSLTRQRCSQGLCPWTPLPPLSRATHSVSFLPSFRPTSVVVFVALIFVFYWKIVNFNMAAIAHLGLRFSWLWNHRRVPSAELMLNTKFGSNRTNRFEVIQFLVNFILDFEKMAVLTNPVSGRCQCEALCQIWWESD